MQLKKLSFEETQSFSTFFLDYINQKDSLKNFYGLFPTVNNFKDQIVTKKHSFPSSHRKALTDVLAKQYEGLKIADVVKDNLYLLKDDHTFTVTTGHQLNIFTGPLYFIYKIVTVINACKELKKAYPAYNFVPVYWMASEDHDYEEIKYFKLYGKKYTWVTEQTGAVGRFNPKSIDAVLKEVPGEISVFKNAYTKNNTLANAVRYYVNELFGNEGLVVVDADHRELKSLFKKVIADDIFSNSTKKWVEDQNKKLEAFGYQPQVFARDINFFYLDQGIRSRIEKQNGYYKVLDSSLSFTEEEIKKKIEDEPEKFSPNVILRPVYQEVILPNIAYAGGPAEIIYWLQFKSVFEHHDIPFPILMPRNFAAVIEAHVNRKFEKTGIEFKHLFEDNNLLFNHWIIKNSSTDLSLGKELAALTSIFDTIKSRVAGIDSTLIKYAGAQATRSISGLEKIEQKMLRAEKRKHREKLGQLESVKNILFPGGSPQERVDNFLNFYQKDPDFIKKLMAYFDPFDFKFNLLFYDEE